MRIVAVIPARMGSERLPGKVLLPVRGKPLLGHLIDRVRMCRGIDEVVVATSDKPENDAIENYCASRSILTFHGSEDDVLSRLDGVMRLMHADTGVLLFGDGPLIDPRIIDDCINVFCDAGEYDLVSNDLKTNWPPGMEVEVFGAAAIEDANASCVDPAVREHGTLFIRTQPERYRLYNIDAPREYKRPDLSFEVDEEVDFLVIEKILMHFNQRPDFTLRELIDFMDKNPNLREMTANVERRWKQYRET